MPKMKIYGLDKYEKILNEMSNETVQVVGEGIYEGANILANAIRQGIQSIRTEGPSKWERERREEQKRGLSNSFGIAPLQDDKGFYNVKLGFEGYNNIKTPSYPNGQPNVLIARMYNSGTSVLSKQLFFEKSVRSARNLAKKKAVETIEQKFEKLTKE